MNILQACDDPNLFRPWFKNADTWRAWRAFLCALFGLPFEDGPAEELFEECTGRLATGPTEAAEEAWLIVGRRGGKSFIMALLAVFLACFKDYRPYLAPGERAMVLLIAADRRQARVLMRYIRGFLTNVKMLKRMVQRESAEGVDLNNSVSIEIATASFRAVRGYTCCAILADEIAFWHSEESSSNPDSEILAALAPSTATIPNAVLICASSPYAKRGVMWDALRKHYGKPTGPLVWKAPTRVMHPTVRQSLVDAAMERDPAAARSEWLAEFRDDIAAFVSREIVESCVDPNEIERAYNPALRYTAFVDPSGGSSDSFTLAIAHKAKNSSSSTSCARCPHRSIRKSSWTSFAGCSRATAWPASPATVMQANGRASSSAKDK